MASSNVSAVVNFFSTANEGFTTTLGSTITSAAATVPLNSVTGLTNGTVFVGIIEPGAIAQQTFTGTVDTGGSQITGVKWVRGTNVGHAGGATIVDYVTGAGHNMFTTGFLKQHTQTGAHGVITGTSLNTTGAVVVGSGLTVSAGTVVLPDNSITANQLATSAITLGYAQITSTFTTTSGTAVQVTGLTSTVTIPSGGRKIEITAYARDLNNSSSVSYETMTIWDGTVGSGTQLTSVQVYTAGTSQGQPAVAMAVVTPAAGSKTYNVGLQTTAGTGLLEAGATFPAFILIKVI